MADRKQSRAAASGSAASRSSRKPASQAKQKSASQRNARSTSSHRKSAEGSARSGAVARKGAATKRPARTRTAPGEAAGRLAKHAAGAAAGVVLDKAEGVIGKARQVVRGQTATVHVDLVKNEWLAGYQHVVARVTLVEGDGLHVDAPDPQWEEVAMRPVGGLDPNSDPEAFLASLSSHVHGTYLFATEPHDNKSCPYQDVVVPIESAGDSIRQTHPV